MRGKDGLLAGQCAPGVAARALHEGRDGHLLQKVALQVPCHCLNPRTLVRVDSMVIRYHLRRLLVALHS